MKRVDLVRYTVTAPQLDGELIYGYDADEVLREFDNRAELNSDMRQFFGTRLPVSEKWFMPLVRQFQKSFGVRLEVQRIEMDLSFEAFWSFYDYKVGNKKRSEDIWSGKKPTNTGQRLTEADKLKAFKIMPKLRYSYKLKNKDLPYMETFLYQRRFENEF